MVSAPKGRRGTLVSVVLCAAADAAAASQNWVEGTYTTGYWDCCKPSCSWRDKGGVTAPVRTCDKRGKTIADPDAESVCDGGVAASCIDNQPWVANEGVALGFAAAAVSGAHGLVGDENCGQCFELRFIDKQHTSDSGHKWGGAHPDMVDKAMVIQVTNIGHDVTGTHSFDIQIPSAGQGLFDTGCPVQFPGYDTDEFDCGTRYGGCENATGCDRLPPALRPGCEFRFGWYRWMADGGQSHNPWVRFRRVRCPMELVDITGTRPLDDSIYPTVNLDDYAPGATTTTTTAAAAAGGGLAAENNTASTSITHTTTRSYFYYFTETTTMYSMSKGGDQIPLSHGARSTFRGGLACAAAAALAAVATICM